MFWIATGAPVSSTTVVRLRHDVARGSRARVTSQNDSLRVRHKLSERAPCRCNRGGCLRAHLCATNANPNGNQSHAHFPDVRLHTGRFVMRRGRRFPFREHYLRKKARSGGRFRSAPLRTDTRIRQASHQIEQRVAIARIRHALARFCGLQFFDVLRQYRMWKTGALVMHAVKWFVQEREGNHAVPASSSRTMLRVEPFTVSPVMPTCSMYLRQLCKLPAMTAGTAYIQMKYFHSPNAATVQTMSVQNKTIRASSAQMRRRTRLLRTGDGEHKKARRKTNGP